LGYFHEQPLDMIICHEVAEVKVAENLVTFISYPMFYFLASL